MRIRLHINYVLLILTLPTTPLATYAATPRPATDMTGPWHANTVIMNAKGQLNQLKWTITFNKQMNGFLTGQSHWELYSTNPQTNKQDMHTGDEHFIGMFDPKHHTFSLAQTAEQAILQGTMINKDHFQLNYLQGGPQAAAAQAMFSRMKVSATQKANQTDNILITSAS